MVRTIDNKTISFEIPAGFAELTNREISELGGRVEIKAGKMISNHLLLNNKGKHMRIEMLWRKVPFFMDFVSTKRAVKSTARKYKRVLISFSNMEMITKTIAGRQADGFRFETKDEGVDKVTEYLLLKHNKMFYAFTCTMRKQNLEKDYALFQELLDSITINR